MINSGKLVDRDVKETVLYKFFFSWCDNPLVGLGLLIREVCFSRSHTMTHQTVGLLCMSDQLIAETSI